MRKFLLLLAFFGLLLVLGCLTVQVPSLIPEPGPTTQPTTQAVGDMEWWMSDVFWSAVGKIVGGIGAVVVGVFTIRKVAKRNG